MLDIHKRGNAGAYSFTDLKPLYSSAYTFYPRLAHYSKGFPQPSFYDYDLAVLKYEMDYVTYRSQPTYLNLIHVSLFFCILAYW